MLIIGGFGEGGLFIGLPISFARALHAGRKTGLRVVLRLVPFPGLAWVVLIAHVVFFRIDLQKPLAGFVANVSLGPWS